MAQNEQCQDGKSHVSHCHQNRERGNQALPLADLPHRLSQVERYHGDGNEEHDG
jgi:hypothetical protein